MSCKKQPSVSSSPGKEFPITENYRKKERDWRILHPRRTNIVQLYPPSRIDGRITLIEELILWYAEEIINRRNHIVFQSSAVALEWNQNNLILKRGESMLFIKAENIESLRTMESEKDFQDFFKSSALENREARRVFGSWERKDRELLSKLYAEVKS